MSQRLRVEPVRSVGRARHCLSPGDAGDYGDYDDGVLDVADDTDADHLIARHPNVHRIDESDDSEPSSEPRRANVDNDGVEYEHTGDDAGDGEPPFHPDDFTVQEFEEEVQTVESLEALDALDALEEAGSDRVGVHEAITNRREELED